MTIEESHYMYRVDDIKSGDGMVEFVDATEELETCENFLKYSLIFGGGCLIGFFIIVTAMSGKAIRPIARNIESQKQFITNASHELKTPVAIISANAEVLEMMHGESEPTDNILSQTKRLTGLIDDLIALARLGEKKKKDLSEIDASPIAMKVCESFKALAESRNIKLRGTIENDIPVVADEKGLEELFNIFLDNALKYCDEGGTVSFEAKRRTRTKGLRTIISNDYKEGKDINYDRFFERFYRNDISHNSQKEGYGIGLSMAQSIVEAHKGKIRVNYKEGRISFVINI